MTYTCFDVSIENNIAHIILNRPEIRNAMSPEFWDELPLIVQDIDDNAKARVIVISSTGPHFTAGIDIKAFMGSPGVEAEVPLTRAAEFYTLVKYMQDTFNVLESCRVPIIAAIQGGCIGGGVDLSTACDMRYATKDAYFTIHEINIGMTADVGTFPRIVNLIPEGIARELAYTGRKMPSDEAKSYGLVNKVFDDQQAMLDGVMQIAGHIASQAPTAIFGTKRIINYSRDHTTVDALDYIATWNASMLDPLQMLEAMTAQAQNREPEFAELPPIKRALKRVDDGTKQ